MNDTSALRALPAVADRHDGALVIGAAATIAVLLAQLMDFGYGRDQGIFAVVGQTIRDGGVPYRDAWDFKPPGIYFLYALAGPTSVGIRALEVLAWISLVFAFVRLSRRYLDDGRAGVVAGVIAVLTHVRLDFWHTAQPESFGAPLVAWGMAWAADASDDIHSSGHRRTRFWTASGVCYGAAMLLKPTIGVAGVVGLGLAWIASGRSTGSRPAFLRTGGAFVAGAAIPVMTCLGFFVARGGLSDLASALFDFVPRYTALAWQQIGPAQLTGRLIRGWLFDYSLLITVGFAMALVFPPTGLRRRGLLHVLAVIGVLLIGVFAQARLFAYHYGTVLPITALVAGWGWWSVWSSWRTRPAGIAGFVLLAGTLTMWPSAATAEFRDTFVERLWFRADAWARRDNRTLVRDRLYSLRDYPAEDIRRAAEWIAHETAPDSRVLVYGFAPAIYVEAQRAPASRYIYNVPTRAPWSRAGARHELMAALNEAPPEVVLVEHDDLLPWVTGTHQDSAGDLEAFPALRAFLSSRYMRAGTIGRFDLYRFAR
jgi:hypothetical protein